MSGPRQFTLPDFDPAAAEGKPPLIVSFTGAAKGGDKGQLPQSLQVAEGTAVALSWRIEGEVDALSLDGANQSLPPSQTGLTVRPGKDLDYTLRASNAWGDAAPETVHVSVHGKEAQVAPHLPVAPRANDKIAIEDGDDILIDPPLRLWAQYDPRWKKYQLGGADEVANITWQKDGCSAACAAMILRWFAEDRNAVPFPVWNGTQLPEEAYGPRLGQALWPEGFRYYDKPGHAERPGNPDGKVSLMGKKGEIDHPDIFDLSAYWLRNGQLPKGNENERRKAAQRSAYSVTSLPKGNKERLALTRGMLKSGPCILGLGEPARHFVVAQGIRKGALLVVDPGAVLKQALQGGRSDAKSPDLKISSWKGRKSAVTGQGRPAESQWRKDVPKGIEFAHEFDYLALSGQILDALLGGLQHVHSLSFGTRFATGAAGLPAAVASKPPTLDEALVILRRAEMQKASGSAAGDVEGALDTIRRSGRYTVDEASYRVGFLGLAVFPITIESIEDYIVFVDAVESAYPSASPQEIASELRQLTHATADWAILSTGTGIAGAAGKPYVDIEDPDTSPIARWFDLPAFKKDHRVLDTRSGRVDIQHVLAGIDTSLNGFPPSYPKQFLAAIGHDDDEYEMKYDIMTEESGRDSRDFATWAGDLGQAYAAYLNDRHVEFRRTIRPGESFAPLAAYVALQANQWVANPTMKATPAEILGDIHGYIAVAVAKGLASPPGLTKVSPRISNILRDLYLVDKASSGQTHRTSFEQVAGHAGAQLRSFVIDRARRFARIWYAKLFLADDLAHGQRELDALLNPRKTIDELRGQFDVVHQNHEGEFGGTADTLGSLATDFLQLLAAALR